MARKAFEVRHGIARIPHNVWQQDVVRPVYQDVHVWHCGGIYDRRDYGSTIDDGKVNIWALVNGKWMPAERDVPATVVLPEGV